MPSFRYSVFFLWIRIILWHFISNWMHFFLSHLIVSLKLSSFFLLNCKKRLKFCCSNRSNFIFRKEKQKHWDLHFLAHSFGSDWFDFFTVDTFYFSKFQFESSVREVGQNAHRTERFGADEANNAKMGRRGGGRDRHEWKARQKKKKKKTDEH